MEQELEVQKFERASLGKEDIDSLGGHRLRRRQRIDDDTAHFRTRASVVSLRPRALPTNVDIAAAVAAGHSFSALELSLMSAIETVYVAITQARSLELAQQMNAEFLKEINWVRRDAAVRQRDNIMELLTRFEPALITTWRILEGELDPAELEALHAELIELAPNVDIGSGSISELVLSDEIVRQQVIDEMRAEMAALDFRFVPLEPEDELRERMASAQTTLIKQSELVEVLVEDGDLSTELSEVEARLADKGVNSIDDEERRELKQRKNEILVRRQQLQATWRNTPPAQPFAAEFMDAQDALLRRRLVTLGTRGALFTDRYLALRSKRDKIDPEIPVHTWNFLTDQAALSEAALAAVPPPDPRAGLDLTPRVLLDPATRAKQQQLIKLLKKAHASNKASDSARELFPELKPSSGDNR